MMASPNLRVGQLNYVLILQSNNNANLSLPFLPYFYFFFSDVIEVTVIYEPVYLLCCQI